MTDQSRRRISTIVRYGVCAAAISWLVYATDREQLRQVLTTIDVRLAVFSLIAFGPAPLIISIRLKWLLAVHDIRLSVWQAIRVTFAGNFLINALPVGTPGGDSAKAYYIARETPHKHEAVTTVFFDRFIGLLGLFGLAGVVLLVNWRNPAFATLGQGLGIALAVVMVGAMIFFSHRLRKLFRLDFILSKLPFSAHFRRIDRAAFAFRNHVGLLIGCLALSISLQLVSIFSTFLAGWALGLVGSDPAAAVPVYLGYVPICYVSHALPIGVPELLFQQLFADTAKLGTAEAALLLALSVRLVQLIWALPGLLVVLSAGRPRDGATRVLTETEPKPGMET